MAVKKSSKKFKYLLFLIISFIILFLVLLLILVKEPTRKSITVIGFIKSGWFAHAVISTFYLETNEGKLYALYDDSKYYSFFSCQNTAEECPRGKKVKIEGLITENKVEIYTQEQKRINAGQLTVNKAYIVK